MKRRLISVVLVFAILNSMISISAYALDGIEDEVVTLIPAEGMCVEIDKENYDDIMFVPEEMAKQIAMLFVSDIVDCDDSTKWDHDTEVIDVIPLYNEDITEVTAYTVYLTSGYVIVSAYLDTPSQVTEWSDVAEPVVEDFECIDDEDKVIYLGAFDYYLDDGEKDVKDIYGNEVERDELVNEIEISREAENIPALVLEEIADEAQEMEISVQSTSTEPRRIFNPIYDANYMYKGPFVCHDYVNKWDKYATFHTLEEQDIADGACVPMAITNALCTYGNRYSSYSSISKNFLKTFKSVVRQVGAPWFMNGIGVKEENCPGYMGDCLKYFEINATVSSKVTTNYDNLKSYLGSGSLLVLGISGYNLDKTVNANHAVMCYAYTRLVSKTTGWYKTYIKTADGIESRARYYDLATIIPKGTNNQRDSYFFAIQFS